MKISRNLKIIRKFEKSENFQSQFFSSVIWLYKEPYGENFNFSSKKFQQASVTFHHEWENFKRGIQWNPGNFNDFWNFWLKFVHKTVTKGCKLSASRLKRKGDLFLSFLFLSYLSILIYSACVCSADVKNNERWMKKTNGQERHVKIWWIITGLIMKLNRIVKLWASLINIDRISWTQV